MKSFDHDELHYFRFDTLPNNGVARHAVFSRRGGVSPAPFDSLNLSLSVPDERERVYANRRRVYGLFGRDTDTVVHAHLVHGAPMPSISNIFFCTPRSWIRMDPPPISLPFSTMS